MARRGKFGHAPAPAPNLASTIVAIAREMQNRRDQNIVEAWKTGGVFEGKPVTDSQILSYWKGRLDDVDKTDPMYDTYKTAYMQFDYSIAESKVSTEYAKITNPTSADDMKVARFYLNWSKKVPKDSEFYRVLQRDAAQFLRSAKTRGGSGGGGGGGGGSTAALKASLDSIERQKELPGQTAVQILTLLAQKGGVLGSTPMGGPEKILSQTNLDELQIPGVDDVVALLNQVSVSDGKGGRVGTTQVLYHDASGKPVTGADIVNQMRAADPTFSGRFDLNYVNKTLGWQRQGITQRIALLQKTGHASDASDLQTHLSKLNELGQQIRAFPVLESYALLKDEERRIVEDGTLSLKAKLDGLTRVRAAIGKLADDPSIATDDHMRAQLIGEATGKEGTLTLSEDMQGYKSGFTTEQDAGNSEVANVNAIIESAQYAVDLAADPSGAFVMTQGEWKGGAFTPVPGGSAQGVATRESVQALSGPAGVPIEVKVPNGDGKGFTSMMLVPGAVTAVALDANGNKYDQTNKNPVASFVRYPVNGQVVTLYGIKDAATGTTRWTADAPFGKGFEPKVGPGGNLIVDLSAYVQGQIAAGNLDKAGTSSSGVVSRTLTNGTVVYGFDPAAAAYATDPVRQAAGFDKETDSYSPTLAGLSGSPDSSRLMIEYRNDPSYAADQMRDANVAAGVPVDPATGAWAVPTPQQAEIIRRSLDANAFADQKAEYGDRPVGDRWWRDTTETQMAGASRPRVVNAATGFSVPGKALPLDALRREIDNKFGALANTFVPGTNLIRTTPTATPETAIRAGETLKLPSIAPTPLVKPPSPTAPSRIYEPTVKPTPTTTPTPNAATGFNTNLGIDPIVTPLSRQATTAVTAKPIYGSRAI